MFLFFLVEGQIFGLLRRNIICCELCFLEVNNEMEIEYKMFIRCLFYKEYGNRIKQKFSCDVDLIKFWLIKKVFLEGILFVRVVLRQVKMVGIYVFFFNYYI